MGESISKSGVSLKVWIFVAIVLMGMLIVVFSCWHKGQMEDVKQDYFRYGEEKGYRQGYTKGYEEGYAIGFEEGEEEGRSYKRSSGSYYSTPTMTCIHCGGRGVEAYSMCRGAGCFSCSNTGVNQCFFCKGSGRR